ncbi:MAG TPA: TolC family protein [Longimicrobium sp.]|nr:TolC family protein [Longimicrobium sp.]
MTTHLRSIRAVALPLLLAATVVDAAAQAGPSLTLEQAVRQGLAASPALQEAHAQYRTAGAGRGEAWGRLLPSVQVEAGLVTTGVLQRTVSDPITGGIVSLPDSLIALRNSYGTSAAVTARWEVLNPTSMLQVRAASVEATAAGRTLTGARARVAAEITLAYLDALEAQALLELRRAESDRAAELLRSAEGRLSVGAVPELDVLQARLAVGDAELAVMEAQTAAEAARLALHEHLGAGADVSATLAEPVLPDAASLPSDEELRRRVMDESAELAALRSARTAAGLARSAERMRLIPTVSVWAQWVRSEYGATRDAMTLQPRNEFGEYGLNFTWTLLDQPGSRVAARQRAGAAVQQADARLSARRAALAREVEVAAGTLRRAALLQQRAAANLELAARQREQAAERYRVGVAPIVERMQAEGLAREAERQAVAARFAPLRALAQLQRVSGAPVLPFTF